ncbi:unnamed protein product [Rotaria socialis]|uniref:SHSP domain-containing protein n=1 Tax=Rotaria socialis TaxID=392032 RepID=A0A820QV91_9BILA|nr:unnamed protein product [Rotaria socialis]CAF3375625.1 unnamed protein product [Rotaria socialis]CAF4286244.1 unnamed protein product [Rotaria socialis]CAF4426156.1 unnamed protein product [Rotaria socialis]
MLSQEVPIHRTNNNSVVTISNKTDTLFDAFNYAPGQDRNIRWLSRPNQKIVQEKCLNHTEKFRISFDAENFQPEQIRIFIENRVLTITGVYEERSEGRFTQKQFEKSFDVPYNADIETVASYITPEHMLVVEIPLSSNIRRPSAVQTDLLNVNNDQNNQRRVSFSLNKFNTLNNQGLLSTINNQGSLSTSNNLSPLPAEGQQVRRTSITKTTTTATSTGSTSLPPEIEELLRSADITTGSTQTHNGRVTERRLSNTGSKQITTNESNSSSTITSTNSKSTNSTYSKLANLPIEIPAELLATGGTITIQKRKVSVTKTTDPNANNPVQVPITSSDNTNSTSSTNTQTSLSTSTSVQSQLPPTVSTERRSSQTISSNNQKKTFTLGEFLQNPTWNPTLVDGSNGKKILHMRLAMKPGTKADQLTITLNGYDLRIEVHNSVPSGSGQMISEQSYHQITLFPSCEINHLATEIKSDGFLHIQVPIKL